MPISPGQSAKRSLTDTHCHLNHEQFTEDVAQVLRRARDAGLERMLVVGYDLASSRAAVSLALEHDDLQAVIGIHPEAAAEWNAQARDELLSLSQAEPSKIAAWGEIGLDYHWDSVSRDEQRAVFEAQLDCAAASKLPIVIHCRDAYDDVLDSVAGKSFQQAVLHCFTGTPIQAARAISLGLFLGVGGIATFKNSVELRALYADQSIPLDRLLLETDAPYLAPQPWRGKRNEPSYIVGVADMLAELRHSTRDEIAFQTSLNADTLFGRMRRENAIDS